MSTMFHDASGSLRNPLFIYSIGCSEQQQFINIISNGHCQELLNSGSIKRCCNLTGNVSNASHGRSSSRANCSQRYTGSMRNPAYDLGLTEEATKGHMNTVKVSLQSFAATRHLKEAASPVFQSPEVNVYCCGGAAVKLISADHSEATHNQLAAERHTAQHVRKLLQQSPKLRLDVSTMVLAVADMWEEEQGAAVLTPFAGVSLSSMLHYWRCNSHLPGLNMEALVKRMMYCTLTAVKVLQSLHEPLVNRDIKPDNILMEVLDGMLVFRLADYGTALPEGGKDYKVGLTLDYMPPEMAARAEGAEDIEETVPADYVMFDDAIASSMVSGAMDIYGVGFAALLMFWGGNLPYEISLQSNPAFWFDSSTGDFSGLCRYFDALRAFIGSLDLYSPCLAAVPPRIRGLLLRMIDLDPVARPTAQEVLKHPFLADESAGPGRDTLRALHPMWLHREAAVKALAQGRPVLQRSNFTVNNSSAAAVNGGLLQQPYTSLEEQYTALLPKAFRRVTTLNERQIRSMNSVTWANAARAGLPEMDKATKHCALPSCQQQEGPSQLQQPLCQQQQKMDGQSQPLQLQLPQLQQPQQQVPSDCPGGLISPGLTITAPSRSHATEIQCEDASMPGTPVPPRDTSAFPSMLDSLKRLISDYHSSTSSSRSSVNSNSDGPADATSPRHESSKLWTRFKAGDKVGNSSPSSPGSPGSDGSAGAASAKQQSSKLWSKVRAQGKVGSSGNGSGDGGSSSDKGCRRIARDCWQILPGCM